MASGPLLVRFLEQERRLEPGELLSFGRSADVVIDDGNLYMHRVVGRFGWWTGLWWLENLGTKVELQLVGGDGTAARLPPGAQTPIAVDTAAVRFHCGGLPYELGVELSAPPGPTSLPPASPLGATTRRYGDLVLTFDERAMLVELARPYLRNSSVGPESLPSNEAIATSLGWGRSKLNRTLDYLCVRLTKAGVKGLQGSRAQLASNRRWMLVKHAVVGGLVGPDDL